VASARNPRKAGLASVRGSVVKAYSRYAAMDGCGGGLNAIPRLSAQQKKWLQSLYKATYVGGDLEDLRKNATANAKKRCPMCDVGPPKTLDHFLPSSKLPEFSLLHRNLVAICSDCNKTKGDHWSKDQQKQYLHPYFDVIPKAALYLLCEPLVGHVLSPEFQVFNGGGFDSRYFSRIAFQFNELHLASLYEDEAINFFNARRIHWLEILKSSGLALLQRDLVLEAVSAEQEYHRSHWQVVFVRALQSSFVDEALTRATLDARA
jgi:hypothetical protein